MNFVFMWIWEQSIRDCVGFVLWKWEFSISLVWESSLRWQGGFSLYVCVCFCIFGECFSMLVKTSEIMVMWMWTFWGLRLRYILVLLVVALCQIFYINSYSSAPSLRISLLTFLTSVNKGLAEGWRSKYVKRKINLFFSATPLSSSISQDWCP